jgi:hypothetical protein
MVVHHRAIARNGFAEAHVEAFVDLDRGGFGGACTDRRVHRLIAFRALEADHVVELADGRWVLAVGQSAVMAD